MAGSVTMHNHGSIRLSVAMSLIVLALGSALATAQSNDKLPASDKAIAIKSVKPPATDEPATGVKRGANDVVEVIGADGQPVLIPAGETLEAFRNFLKSRLENTGPTAPPFSVSGITFEGVAETNEDSVTLDATIAITLNRDDEDVLVPLRLNEATILKKPIHDGPHEAAFDVFDPEVGYRCWLNGKGAHELKLALAVPIRKQVANRRLMLRLPETPGHTIKLSVPLSNVSAKGVDRGFVRTKPLENGHTEIQVFGPPGNLLDVSWQSIANVSESKPELQALTLIVADLRAETLVLEATQQVRAIQGTFDKVTVRLPSEFELFEVSGREVKEFSKVSDSPPRVTVTLSAPTSGPVELKWVLSAKIPADALRLPAVEGFEVEDSRQQRGHVVMAAWEGVNVRKRDGEDRFVNRDTLAALRDIPNFHVPANGSGNATVFRFLKQPFRLVFDVQKVEPYFTSEQTHLVRLAASQADLETTLNLRVFRGSLLDLTLPWPGYKSEGWESVSNDTPEVVEQISVEDTPTGPQLRVRLLERKTRGDSEFEIRLTTRRGIPSDGTAFDLSLPFVAASGQKASKVIVAPSNNLEVEWSPKNDAVALPTTPDKSVLEQLASTRSVTAWRWEAGTPEFAATVKVQQQTISSESYSELAFDSRAVKVTQRIAYEVAFEPLSQARLMVPRSILDRVRFQLRDSNGRTRTLPPPIFTSLEIDQNRQCRLSLDPPQVGRFEVLAEFDVERATDLTSDEPTQLSIPVVQSSDSEFGATRVKWSTGEKLVASLDDSSWKPELGADKTSLWKANGARTSIGLRVAAAGDSALQDFTVHRALIRTVINEGRRHSQALYEIDRDVREVLLTLPPGVSTHQFSAWWNYAEVKVEAIDRNSAHDEKDVRLRRPRLRSRKFASEEAAEGDDASKDLLLLDYYSEEPTHFSWSNQHHLVSPKFASSVWITQTIWQVTLPADQHLLTTPRDYATLFHWQRSLLLWSRQPRFSDDLIDREFKSITPNDSSQAFWEASLTAGTSDRNVYPVSCFGPPQPLIFWSMSRSAVVGCGAGLALILGFLLIRIPATRHVLTFLIIGFIVSLAALWLSEPVKVLLQPAILGTAMAIVAAVIDRVGHRQPTAPLVTLSSPSDFFAASGSGVRVEGNRAMVEASTAAPRADVPIEPIAATGSASGVRA